MEGWLSSRGDAVGLRGGGKEEGGSGGGSCGSCQDNARGGRRGAVGRVVRFGGTGEANGHWNRSLWRRGRGEEFEGAAGAVLRTAPVVGLHDLILVRVLVLGSGHHGYRCCCCR